MRLLSIEKGWGVKKRANAHTKDTLYSNELSGIHFVQYQVKYAVYVL